MLTTGDAESLKFPCCPELDQRTDHLGAAKLAVRLSTFNYLDYLPGAVPEVSVRGGGTMAGDSSAMRACSLGKDVPPQWG